MGKLYTFPLTELKDLEEQISIKQMLIEGEVDKHSKLRAKINTPGNELFPSVTEDGRLYFSSDNHEGFGGLDIFVATRRGGEITITNPGKPLNSRGDDFGVNPFNNTRGFFTSNRDGGSGDDDIYTFVNNDPNLKIVNYILKGTTLTPKNNGNDLDILGNSVVKLLDKDQNVIEETFTDNKGKFEFKVYTDENYILIGEKKIILVREETFLP